MKKTESKIDSLLYVDKVRTSNGEWKKWDKFYFEKMPLTAAVTLLSKFQMIFEKQIT